MHGQAQTISLKPACLLPFVRITKPYLDFNLVESLAVVHSNHGPNHFRQDDHVSQVSLNHLWFLHGRSLLLGLAQALQERLLLAAQATVQPPSLAGTVQLHQLLAKEGGKKMSVKFLAIGKVNYSHVCQI